MTVCKQCRVAQADSPSGLCGDCAKAAPEAPIRQDGLASNAAVSTAPVTPVAEGAMTSAIGKVIMWLSLVAAGICVILFGRIEMPNGLGGTQTIWSTTLVASFVAAGVNGIFFGFLLSKVGSVLRHLEKS